MTVDANSRRGNLLYIMTLTLLDPIFLNLQVDQTQVLITHFIEHVIFIHFLTSDTQLKASGFLIPEKNSHIWFFIFVILLYIDVWKIFVIRLLLNSSLMFRVMLLVHNYMYIKVSLLSHGEFYSNILFIWGPHHVREWSLLYKENYV